jgi:hypothetical protein
MDMARDVGDINVLPARVISARYGERRSMVTDDRDLSWHDSSYGQPGEGLQQTSCHFF